VTEKKCHSKASPFRLFYVIITHPLQHKNEEIAMEEAGMVAEEAHDNKLQKSLEVC